MGFLIEPPVLPMLAKRVDAIPEAEGWSFEPKWDGFRAVVFRDGEELMLQVFRYQLTTKPTERLPRRCSYCGHPV